MQDLPDEVSFAEIEGELTDLLVEFGPLRQSYHPEYPFWRLQNDGIWEVTSDMPLRYRTSNTDIPVTELRQKKARGRLPQSASDELSASPLTTPHTQASSRSSAEKGRTDSSPSITATTIEATASGQASEKRWRLDELMHVLQRGDRLVVSELSRLGRSLGQIVAILDALAKARSSGRKLGRPKGSLGVSRLNGKEADIRRFLELGLSKTAIAKLTGVSRTTLHSFMRTRGLKPSPWRVFLRAP